MGVPRGTPQPGAGFLPLKGSPDDSRMRTLHVTPEKVQVRDGEVVLRAVYSGFDLGSKTIEIAVAQAGLPRIPTRNDHFALIALFPAMQMFDRCVIHGAVSRTLLENLSELTTVWQVWRPEKYRLVQWEADEVVEPSLAGGQRAGHLLAFSGGVDATVTLKRYTDGGLGWRNRTIKGALLVHGFDIALTDQESFQRAGERGERITSSVGVPLIRARTNLRELPNEWTDSFAAMLSGVMQVFNETFEGGVFASDEPYAFPKLPWGSNPITNLWLGTERFPIRTDGAEFTRLEKVRLVSTWETAIKNIRVCWEGNIPGENCGACEKCVRTLLELAVCGITPGDNFHTHLSPGKVLGIQPTNDVQMSYLAEVLEHSEQNNGSAWWAEELRQVVGRGVKIPKRKKKKRFPFGLFGLGRWNT